MTVVYYTSPRGTYGLIANPYRTTCNPDLWILEGLRLRDQITISQSYYNLNSSTRGEGGIASSRWKKQKCLFFNKMGFRMVGNLTYKVLAENTYMYLYRIGKIVSRKYLEFKLKKHCEIVIRSLKHICCLWPVCGIKSL